MWATPPCRGLVLHWGPIQSALVHIGDMFRRRGVIRNTNHIAAIPRRPALCRTAAQSLEAAMLRLMQFTRANARKSMHGVYLVTSRLQKLLAQKLVWRLNDTKTLMKSIC